ncbi:SH3 domain-containing protein [Bacillus lacus]|uniref:SH3 domain-containing protein n=1 Tax=Metabacillus lacus TaxID=1983721 RepID=A0A7X2LYT3_9BACI|nr:N-acetylmuramoyl-L-alanine amidase [Metabacillus lacus]MRX72173.1 SH3 domain-containing protein [Metabacillus lacus]
MKKWVFAIVCFTVIGLLPIHSNAETIFKPLLGEVISDSTAIHRGATADYAVVKTIHRPDKVTVMDEFVNNSGEKWFRIQHGGTTGWTMSNAVSTSPKLDAFLFTAKSNVTIHRGATKNYSITETLEKNTMVKVLDSFVNQNHEIWLRIEAYSVTGWVLMNDLSQKPEKLSGFVEKGGIAVKRGAESGYLTIHTLKQDERVSIIDFFTNSNHEPWYRLELSNGTMGWVPAAQLTLRATASPSNLIEHSTIVYAKVDQATVRSGALNSYRIVYQAKLNEKLSVVSSFTNNLNEKWYRVEFAPNQFGWIHNVQTGTEPTLNGIFYVRVNNTNIRSGASTDYRILTALNSGTSVKVVDQYVNSSGQRWLRVQLNQSTFGWVLSTLLQDKPMESSISKLIGTYNAELRRGAGYSYAVVEKLPYNSRVTSLSEFLTNTGERWVNVELSNGRRGWVPHWELYDTLSSRKFVYVKSSDVIRRGASASYASRASVSGGETLLLLNEINGWYNVETLKGVRGWIQSTKVAAYQPNGLMNFRVTSNSRTDTELTWDKTTSAALSYKLLSDRSIQVNVKGLMVDLPAGALKGVSSISHSGDFLTIKPQANYMFTVRDKNNQLSLTVMPVGIQGKKIIIDAGHGGTDPGAIGPTGLREKEVALAVAKHLATYLTSNGAHVSYTRETDIYLTLDQRTTISNSSDHDIFVSIHANASTNKSARGTETFFNLAYNFNGDKSSILSRLIQQELVKQLNTTDRGSKAANFYVLRYNNLPSALVELAFMSNPTEENMLRQDLVRKRAAEGIYNGIKKYFDGGY